MQKPAMAVSQSASPPADLAAAAACSQIIGIEKSAQQSSSWSHAPPGITSPHITRLKHSEKQSVAPARQLVQALFGMQPVGLQGSVASWTQSL
jgi:hypothetical protein